MSPTKEDLLEFYNTIPGNIDEQAYNSDILVQKYFQRRKTHEIKKALNVGSHDLVLDIGCGSGVQIREITENGYIRAIGIDVNRNALEYARSKGIPNTEYLIADAQHLPIKSGCIDKLICAEIIEHLITPQNLITEIKRVLKYEGEVVITTPNAKSIWKLYEFMWDRFGRGRNYGETHLHLYTEFGLTHHFSSFSKCKTKTIFFLSPLFALFNNQTLLTCGVKVDRIFERIGWGVSIVCYAKK
jgi:2-polyprenyl-3-methyl-5-hydroxy-6-metoxy-1,4-benzoquinol methylase